MLRTLLSTLAAALALSAPLAAAQDLSSNATSLTGTWSSGSGAVVTGPVSRCTGLYGLVDGRIAGG